MIIMSVVHKIFITFVKKPKLIYLFFQKKKMNILKNIFISRRKNEYIKKYIHF